MKHILFVILLSCLDIVSVKASDKVTAMGTTENDSIAISLKDISKGAFGWATCTSLTNTGYRMTGGDGGNSVILTSNGSCMDENLSKAIHDNAIIILDGSNGPFIIGRSIPLDGLRNKTIFGINGAELRTKYEITDEIRAALDSAGVKKMKNKNGEFILPNNKCISEWIEYNTRKVIMELTGDKKEKFRNSGIFLFSNCENIIIRNITFTGPGSVDVGGRDLFRITPRNKHFWIDHCVFADGQKGHINISQGSDFCTISNCRFIHTARSYSHAFSILIGGTLRAEDAGMLNITLAGNHWDKGCRMRVPMVRSGHVHVYNNYYDCPGANGGVNARDASHLLVENCYWSKDTPKCFSADKAAGYTLRNNCSERGIPFPENLGEEETVPYDYSLTDTFIVREHVLRNSGTILEITSENQ